MRKIKLTRSQRQGVYGLSLLVFSIIFASAIVPSGKYSYIRSKIAINQDTKMRYIWGRTPFALKLHITMFNVTNPDAVDKGAKPILEEVGPYVYDEYQDKIFQEDRVEDDTVSYNARSFYYFNKELSAPLTGHEEIVAADYFSLTIMNIIVRDRPGIKALVGKALNFVLKKPKSLFMRQKTKNILFDGMLVDCTVPDFAGAALCGNVEDVYEEYGLIRIADKKYHFSFIGPRNGTIFPPMRVNRGYKKLNEIHNVVWYDGNSNFSLWNDDRCDKFRGSDLSAFRPFLNKKGKDNVEIVYTQLCRSFLLRFDGFGEWNGVKTIRYAGNLGTDGKNVLEDRCYCWEPKNPDTCLKKGAFDVSKCVKLPVIVTNPHFLFADESYARQVVGMKPDKEKHMVIVEVDPLTGLKLRVNLRAQFNLFIMKIEKFKLMENFPDALMPLFWIDQVMELPPNLSDQIKSIHRVCMYATIVQYLLIFSALGMCGYAGFKMYKEHKENKTELRTTVSESADNKIHISTVQTPTLPASVE